MWDNLTEHRETSAQSFVVQELKERLEEFKKDVQCGVSYPLICMTVMTIESRLGPCLKKRKTLPKSQRCQSSSLEKCWWQYEQWIEEVDKLEALYFPSGINTVEGINKFFIIFCPKTEHFVQQMRRVSEFSMWL